MLAPIMVRRITGTSVMILTELLCLSAYTSCFCCGGVEFLSRPVVVVVKHDILYLLVTITHFWLDLHVVKETNNKKLDFFIFLRERERESSFLNRFCSR